mgnify:CR=1 FL=1
MRPPPSAVLMVSNTLPPFDLSGAGEQVVQLASGLRSRGLRVEMLGRGAGGARGPKLLFPLTVVWPALRLLRGGTFDVLQVHESDGGLLILAVRLLRGLARRTGRGARWPVWLVALQQVTYVEEFRAVRTLRDGDSGAVLARPTGAERAFRWLRAPLLTVLGWITARCADRVLVPSQQTAREVRRDYGARNVHVVPNTRAPQAVRDAAAALRRGSSREGRESREDRESSAGRFLFVGRLRIRKGVEVLLAALNEVPEARLDVLGDGERRREIATRIERLGLTERVRLLGRGSADEVHQRLAEAIAVVVPSTYEGMPLVVLEAMECARPVVASSVSGIPEVVVDGETGWLVAPESPSQLAAALRAVLADPVEAERRGRAGRSRLDDRFRPQAAVDCWLAALADPPRD